MDSNTHHNFRNEQHQLQQPNSVLLRFRSAPGSLFTNFTESGVDKADSEFASERLISRFMNCGGGNSESPTPRFQECGQKSPPTEVGINYMSSQQGFSGLPPHYPRQNSSTSSSAMDGSYGLVDSMKPVNSNLARQSSSLAGVFSHLSAQNGYATMKSVRNYRGMNGTNGEVSPSTNRLNRKISFSTRLPSSLGMLSHISEIGNESIGARSPDDGKLGNGNNDTQFYASGYAYGSWNDSSNFSEIFTGMKRDELDNDGKLFSGTQNGELGNRVHVLSHHLSLPKTTSEMAVMEKFLQFQDSAPCKIRAKRGCATHPRSIAERMRRTRISERMRKLQELVPNMDKQTNTADMLDLAVNYIKDLQKQFKTLTENRANCKCLGTQKQVPNQIV